ncbi:hypothetical protein FBEOM_12712 [Fusarium beomiforme]|uniref:Uncharacterized protein n=1 Tax=Fusarium beomiforme TaxID=44412 RepID=A0A9P5DQ26_9HYPO|nr:hypothetical protein FBEOM_12712 [Fusarium beomiforme]
MSQPQKTFDDMLQDNALDPAEFATIQYVVESFFEMEKKEAEMLDAMKKNESTKTSTGGDSKTKKAE